MSHTRRRIVAGLLGVTGMTVVARWALRLFGGPSEAEILVRELVRMVAVPDPIAAGRAYLASAPSEADAVALAEKVLTDLPLGATAAVARRAFRDRLVRDFHQGQTVQADGWYLSRTEARLCALLALEIGVDGVPRHPDS